MLLHITDLSSMPIHEQMFTQIMDKILDGRLTENQRLPGPRVLAREHRVSVHTVARVYEMLTREGLISRGNDASYSVAPLTAEQKRAVFARQRLSSGSPLNAVEKFSKELISVWDTEKMMRIFTDVCRTCLAAGRVYFCLYDHRTDGYRFCSGDEMNKQLLIPASDPLLPIIAESCRPQKSRTLPSSAGTSVLAEQVEACGIKIVVPLQGKERVAGCIGLTDKADGGSYIADEYDLLMILANQFVTALDTARFYIEAVERRRMQQELETARTIQERLLPAEPFTDDRITITGYAAPSAEIGGDFYDVVTLADSRIAVIIGDACGQGLPAALLAAQAQATVASELRHAQTLSRAMEQVNRHLRATGSAGTFVTLFAAVIDRNRTEVEYCSAGHHHPFLIRDGQEVICMGAGGPGLGLMDGAIYATGRMQLQHGDRVFLFTDGVIEAMDRKRQEFGEERLVETVREAIAQGNDTVIDAVNEALYRFTGTDIPADDRTMVLITAADTRKPE
ncbi:SpoIIE family protein phosphatase [bacterium]|nr:SpoIIE family protein phosphatase [bacterium]